MENVLIAVPALLMCFCGHLSAGAACINQCTYCHQTLWTDSTWGNKGLLSILQETPVCIQGRGKRERVRRLCQHPHFLLLIAWQPLGRFSLNLAHVALRKFFEYSVMTFQPIREVI